MGESFRKWVFHILKNNLEKRGWALIKRVPPTRQKIDRLSEEASSYLVEDNPALRSLVDAYRTLDSKLTNSAVWNWAGGGLGNGMLQTFRGDSAYVWQLRGVDIPEFRYIASMYYQVLNDKMGLMETFRDDSFFGNYLFQIRGREVSREILDSSNEINFLERHLHLSTVSDLKILDIGAGYGRLAHRMSQALPGLSTYFCTDGVPESAFICDYYLRFRKVGNAKVVSMPTVGQELASQKIHLAINIHSFSECSVEAIEWWVNLVSTLKIKYLFIVPNAFEDNGATLLTNKRADFKAIIEKMGYRFLIKEPKYSDPSLQRFGLYPTHYHLFELI